MSISRKIIDGNTQPSEGNAIIGIGGARALTSSDALNSDHVLSVDASGQLIADINNSLDTRLFRGKGLVGLYPNSVAAYSLRSLRGVNGGQYVVRLRRAIDSAEKDFSAVDVAAGTAGSELLTNGDFSSGLTGWTADSNWTESGGQAVSDGSVSFGRLYQDNLVSSDAGVYYKVTLEVISATNFTSVGFNVGSSVRLFSFQSSGISSTGTYTVILKTIGGGSRFGFFTSPASTMTIDNVSVKEYTPSAAELWAMNSKDEFSRQPFESAYVTTWYDQSFSQNNATQTTATNQPRLILAGVTNTQDGLAAIDFDGVDNYLTSSAFDNNLAQPNTAFMMDLRVATDILLQLPTRLICKWMLAQIFLHKMLGTQTKNNL
jgi:hypothetical protein